MFKNNLKIFVVTTFNSKRKLEKDALFSHVLFHLSVLKSEANHYQLYDCCDYHYYFFVKLHVFVPLHTGYIYCFLLLVI